MAGLTLNSSSQLGQGAVPVGFPVRGTEICLENDAGQIVGSGEIGEVVVKSPFLAHGYWKEPELTASSFLTDPADGRRFFRTGDLGRWRSDRTLEHLGRKGRKIKVRGFSIEPYEVECELLRQPGISNAVVVLHQDAGKEALLVAYVAAPSIFSRTIRNGSATRLPTHMVPSHIVVMDSLPMTAGGKIDRRALPLPSSKNLPLQSYRAATNEHPRDGLEELVAGVWRDVLKLEQVGVHDNFFELGGHSLLAMQVVARLAKLLKLDLSLQRFFQIATVSALAAELQKKLGAGEARASPPLVSVPRTGDLPLSFAQQRLWFLDRLLPNKATYNIPAVWRLRGPLDAPALERSLNAVVARHETLRTRFVLSDDEPVQVIEPPTCGHVAGHRSQCDAAGRA